MYHFVSLFDVGQVGAKCDGVRVEEAGIKMRRKNDFIRGEGGGNGGILVRQEGKEQLIS